MFAAVPIALPVASSYTVTTAPAGTFGTVTRSVVALADDCADGASLCSNAGVTETFALSDLPGSLIATLAITSLLFLFGIAAAAMKARRRPVVTGREQMIGSHGTVVDGDDGEGWVRVHSELWRARSAHPLASGQTVRVTSKEGLVLTVVPTHTEA